MARVYDARQCDCCGELYRHQGKQGVGICFDNIYITLATDKIQFDDICEPCRSMIRKAIDDALPAFAKKNHVIIDSDFREVDEPLPAPPHIGESEEDPF